MEELSLKTWEEMHYLWWECMKERNRLATEQVERARLKPGYGQYEADERLRAVSDPDFGSMAPRTDMSCLGTSYHACDQRDASGAFVRAD